MTRFKVACLGAKVHKRDGKIGGLSCGTGGYEGHVHDMASVVLWRETKSARQTQKSIRARMLNGDIQFKLTLEQTRTDRKERHTYR